LKVSGVPAKRLPSPRHPRPKFGHEARKDFQQELAEATDLVMEMVGKDQEWESNFLEGRTFAAIESIEKAANSWNQLQKIWEDNWLKIRGCCFFKYSALKELKDKHDWCCLHDFKRCTSEGRYKLKINPPNSDGKTDSQQAKEELLKITREDVQNSVEYNRRYKSKMSFTDNQEKWLAAYNILKSEHVKTGSLFNLAECREVISNMAKLDRLPTENTPQTLVLLRCAWTLVDILHNQAFFYKVTAKCMYIVYLCLGAAIVIMTVLGALYPAEVTDSVLQTVLLVLALTASFAAGWTTFMNPASKWLLFEQVHSHLNPKFGNFVLE